MKTIFNFIFRVIQIAALVFFGYWIYTRYTEPGIGFAFFTAIMLPFLIGALAIGAITTTVFFCKGLVKSNLFTKFYNITMLILYAAAITYFLMFIF